MRTKTELTVGEWAVLALLCERPLHGYAVAAAMEPDGEIGRIWGQRQQLAYRAIRVLRDLGLVEVVGTRPGDRAPRRTELRANARARRLVRAWLAEPVPRPREIRSHLLLKICFLQRAGRPIAPLLETQRDVLAVRVEQLERDLAAAAPPEAFVERWRLLSAQAALRFAEETLAAGDPQPQR